MTITKAELQSADDDKKLMLELQRVTRLLVPFIRLAVSQGITREQILNRIVDALKERIAEDENDVYNKAKPPAKKTISP